MSTPDENKAVLWYQYAIACSSAYLQHTCFDYIILNLDIVIQSRDWVYLTKDNLIMILQRSDLIVDSEYALLQAVVRWLVDEGRVEALTDNLTDILPYIRFPMILPECLAQFEASEFERENHAHFAPYLLAAYRYHALSIRCNGDTKLVDSLRNSPERAEPKHGDNIRNTPETNDTSAQPQRSCSSKPPTAHDIPPSQYLYRNYLDSNYSIHVDVIRKGYRSCPRVSSKVEKPLSLPHSFCNLVTERQCKMKVTFYPQGYYTTSLWNGQLNLCKSTDLTKIVVSHRGGIELHEADVSVVVYAQQDGVRYAAYAINKQHVFEMYGTFEIENTVSIDALRQEDSPYIIDSSLVLKVFIRPRTFQQESTF